MMLAPCEAGLNPEAPRDSTAVSRIHLYQQVLGPIEEIISQKKRLSFVLRWGANKPSSAGADYGRPSTASSVISLDWLVRKYAVAVLPSIASLKIFAANNPLRHPSGR